jgi:hypothetical protein
VIVTVRVTVERGGKGSMVGSSGVSEDLTQSLICWGRASGGALGRFIAVDGGTPSIFIRKDGIARDVGGSIAVFVLDPVCGFVVFLELGEGFGMQ